MPESSAPTTTRPLTVRFALDVHGCGLLDEADEALQTWPSARFCLLGLSGEMRISLGGALVVVQDDITHLAWALGLDAIPAIRTGVRYEMRFYERRGVVLWEPDGDNVVLVIDKVPRERYPRAQLAEALLACVVRLGHCFQRRGSHDDLHVQGEADAMLDQAAELESGHRFRGFRLTGPRECG